MSREASKIEQKCVQKPKPRAAKPSLTGFMALIGRLLFYKPVWTTVKQHHSNIRFIHVHFSAWHFAGSDLLWAGIAIRLFRAMQMEFGKLQLALYRVAQHDEKDEIKKKVVKSSPNEWSSKKICCLPLWLFILSILVIPVVLLVVWIYGLPKSEVKPEPGSNSTNGGTENDRISGVNVLERLLIASLGLPAASALRFTFQMGKNLIFSQELNIRRGMDNDRISSQLGFMNEVRKEMWFLSQFIQFMEVFERRRIRVVLKITSLDRCSPRNIVAVLEAINILLSDDESPFLSILAVNPSILLEKVNSADGCICREDRAYALLNRIVTLAFTVPPLCEDLKRDLFYSLIGSSRISEESSFMGGAQRNKTSSSDLALVEVNESKPLMDRSSAAADEQEKKMETLVWRILSSSEKKLNKYMSDDTLSMKRTINSVWVTLIIMKALKRELPNPETIPAWVVLANQWPCRLSWIIQCVEDANQRAAIDQKHSSIDPSKTLWEVFSESREELYVMRAHIEDLLEQDGDPELFEELLRDEGFEFTLNNLEIFQEATVNMDQSIRRELALIRGMSRLKDSGWIRNIAPLPVTALIKMSTADVCKEMERMEYDTKYINIVKEHMLDGSALVFGDIDDLKALLGMTFGEWATFRLHFLSLPPHLRQTYKNKFPPSGYSKNQLSRFLQHIPSHYSSSSSLGNSCI
ncbi:NTPase KAP family P-loop domain-containing protein 1-like [Nematolebias whitei]|uniref:NTPase KAP family P-loop domain-containing protein 1-like n=1 Tax=Nematolebias whitei TaxID=451745 RepID=UPI001896A92E|nr:NTPase KAP family P-loop domain-containing protein 1-like [Nematolebias whitei]